MSDTMTHANESAETTTSNHRDAPDLQPLPDLKDYAKRYAKENPETVALWCFGVGFIMGWKLKPW